MLMQQLLQKLRLRSYNFKLNEFNNTIVKFLIQKLRCKKFEAYLNLIQKVSVAKSIYDKTGRTQIYQETSLKNIQYIILNKTVYYPSQSQNGNKLLLSEPMLISGLKSVITFSVPETPICNLIQYEVLHRTHYKRERLFKRGLSETDTNIHC